MAKAAYCKSGSPTVRSLAYMRHRGFIAEKVEYRHAFSQTTQDLFGIFDILAIGHGKTVAVQTTAYSSKASRVNKICRSEFMPEILESGWIVEVHGWKKGKQEPHVVRIVEEDLKLD